MRFVVYLWGIFCFAKASWDFKFLQKPRSDKTISLNKILHGFLILSAFILIIVVVLFMLRNSFFIFFYEITLLYYSFFIISMVIFSYRHPDFFNIARNEASRLRYLQSKINGIDVKEVVERLKDIMENEKLYLKNDLSLTKLSELLDLTPHQLSEILNKEMNLNFNIFINRYRIEEAKRILITDKYQTILHIALNSGFNSKTAFNKSFHSAVGLTPKEYRYLHGQDAMQTF
ncbi:MAG TPA: helix-turn-helix domain-containing protein [Spirochaetota bacterium]|nr:helix-turn-helix domain-containing protein [Spirochaetota bacterium]HPK57117.1 helix-turn-helix domain-containing protein [Spirochaetota bacterium]